MSRITRRIRRAQRHINLTRRLAPSLTTPSVIYLEHTTPDTRPDPDCEIFALAAALAVVNPIVATRRSLPAA